MESIHGEVEITEFVLQVIGNISSKGEMLLEKIASYSAMIFVRRPIELKFSHMDALAMAIAYYNEKLKRISSWLKSHGFDD